MLHLLYIFAWVNSIAFYGISVPFSCFFVWTACKPENKYRRNQGLYKALDVQETVARAVVLPDATIRAPRFADMGKKNGCIVS